VRQAIPLRKEPGVAGMVRRASDSRAHSIHDPMERGEGDPPA